MLSQKNNYFYQITNMLVMFPQGNNYITNEYMDSVHRVH